MKAILVGYGKMGRAIEAMLVHRGHGVAGRFGRGEICLEGKEGNGDVWGASSEAAALAADIAFEFTAPEAAPRLVPLLLSKKIPVLSGTTGWDVEPAMRRAMAEGVPFLHSPNFSLGVAAMRYAATVLAASLAPFPEFQPGIVERHHAEKKDAPSGTAKALASDVAKMFGQDIPIVSLRQGGAPGEHALFFEGGDETLELVHRARSRAIFATGAVRAGEWMLMSGRRGPMTFDDFFNDASRGGNTP
jgi:4-hydroxy-tetrahydrodipicolinate reductase